MQFFQLETLGDLNNTDLALTRGPPDGMKLRGYTLARCRQPPPEPPDSWKLAP